LQAILSTSGICPDNRLQAGSYKRFKRGEDNALHQLWDCPRHSRPNCRPDRWSGQPTTARFNNPTPSRQRTVIMIANVFSGSRPRSDGLI